MNSFVRSVSQVMKGAAQAFQTFPAAIGCALAFAVVTIVRIHMDWPQQEAYNFLLNCLHWALGLGAVFSLAAITYAQSRYAAARAFLYANLSGVAAAVVAFLLLYYFGGLDPSVTGARFVVVSNLSAARMSVAIAVSFLAFIYFAGYPREVSDFARSFFMTHKAFFIALIYGGVLMSGTSGVAGAIQALLWEGMSEKVYMYLATLTGFLAFTIFVGYFPDFRPGADTERREVTQAQPRFVEVLLEYILVPVMLALTVVLLLWAGRTVLGGMHAPFFQLSGIATSYTVGGIWLYILVTHNQSGLAKFYRRVYPIAALIILVFEAWALVLQLEKSGLKTAEYSFAIVWIVALAAALLLMFIKERAYPAIVAMICTCAIITVLPVVGAHVLPVNAQLNRLETILTSQGMLQGDQVNPAPTPPDQSVREAVTDAVSYIANAQNVKVPAWFDKNLNQPDIFKNKFGFEMTWPQMEPPKGPQGYLGTNLSLPSQGIDISDYHWVVLMGPAVEKGRASATVQGARGLYRVDWVSEPPNSVPLVRVSLNDRVILEQDLNSYIDRIEAKYPLSATPQHTATVDDMSLRLESPEVDLLLLFSYVDLSVDVRNDIHNYWFNLNAVYMNEKP
ncbi:MAG: DUF4153 domain-containing protein [Syntrophomonadaceae bacterium]